MLDFDRYTHLTFDCYGTLIDWETGILGVVRPVLERHGRTVTGEEILRLYVRLEAEAEAGPYQRYRDVLRQVMAGLSEELGFTATDEDLNALPDSVGSWPPFADTVAALQALKERYRLAIVSNIDYAMFAQTNRLLQVEFDEIVTAQQVRSYKPDHAHFQEAFRRLGAPREQILHVAQSLYHDHVPAKALGLSTVWVNRPSRLKGTGVAPRADATPDMEVPDIASLVDVISR